MRQLSRREQAQLAQELREWEARFPQDRLGLLLLRESYGQL